MKNSQLLQTIQKTSTDVNVLWGIDRNLISLLRDSYLSTLKNNLITQTVLKELDTFLKGKDISCIVWKGASSIFEVYPAPGLRPMDDIDLLIPRDHLKKFERILMQMEFEQSLEYPMTWLRNNITLDLHCDVVHSDRIAARLKAIPITAEKLIRKSRILRNFQNILTLSPYDALICLAVHALKHDYSKEIWFTDTIYLLNRNPEIANHPGAIFQRAKDFHATTPLYILFSLLEKWPQNLTFKFVNRMRPKETGPIHNLFLKSFKSGRCVPHAGEFFFLFLIDSYRHKIEFFRETMFPSQQVMKQLFPDKHLMPYWFYYPHRLFQLTRMGIITLINLIQSSNRKR